MLSGQKLEKLLINHEARFISWRICATSGKAVKPMPSYYININLIGVISLFICYWPPSVTMDAVSATIVAGGLG